MKKSKKMFILTETVLAAVLLLMIAAMLREKRAGERARVSVILCDSDSSSWSAFKYGVRAAAQDLGMEVRIVSTQDDLGAQEEQSLISRELENGADALIVHPAPESALEALLKKGRRNVPVIAVDDVASGEDSRIPVAGADDYAMGKALAEELIRDYNGRLAGKTLGIAADSFASGSVKDREQGFRDAMAKMGGAIVWSVSPSAVTENEKEPLGAQPAVDFVIALDDGALVAAGEEARMGKLHGALVYGIGNSTEAVCFLDLGNVECLVVPDTFYSGYQSLTELNKALEHSFYKMESQVVSYTVLRQETLFLKENQELLFTMNQ